MSDGLLEPIELSPAVAIWVEKLREARNAIVMWKDAEDYAKQELIDAMHDENGNHAEIATVNGDPVVRYKLVAQSRLDTKRLRADLPDVYESFTTMKRYPRVELMS